ncbi:hypothetical protein KI387_001490, partial [Taxus chinensis]
MDSTTSLMRFSPRSKPSPWKIVCRCASKIAPARSFSMSMLPPRIRWNDDKQPHGPQLGRVIRSTGQKDSASQLFPCMAGWEVWEQGFFFNSVSNIGVILLSEGLQPRVSSNNSGDDESDALDLQGIFSHSLFLW